SGDAHTRRIGFARQPVEPKIDMRAFTALLFVLLIPAAAIAQRSAASVAARVDLSRSLQDLSQKVSASVVQIFVTGYAAPEEDDPHAAAQPTFERSSGSGGVGV